VEELEETIWDFLKYIESKLGDRSTAIASEKDQPPARLLLLARGGLMIRY
jgi:hypothetical protein